MSQKDKSSAKPKSEKKVAKTTGKERNSLSLRAGITFPVARVGRFIKKGNYAQRVGRGGPVVGAAVLEYLLSEMLELAGNLAKESKKKRVTPRLIQQAIRGDAELNRMFGEVTFSGGGTTAVLQKQLKKSGSKKRKSSSKSGKKSKKSSKKAKGEKKEKKEKKEKAPKAEKTEKAPKAEKPKKEKAPKAEKPKAAKKGSPKKASPKKESA